jgi:hypothetical protein
MKSYATIFVVHRIEFVAHGIQFVVYEKHVLQIQTPFATNSIPCATNLAILQYFGIPAKVDTTLATMVEAALR